MSTQQVAPICLALILADAIWRDPGSEKRTILGTFSTILAPQFPAEHQLVAVYCVLTDGYGKTEVEVRLVDAEEEKDPLIQATGVVEFNDPRMIVEIDFHFPNIVFPAAGEYRFQIRAAGEFLMERRLLVIDTSQQIGGLEDG